jgi:hypothetical protein
LVNHQFELGLFDPNQIWEDPFILAPAHQPEGDNFDVAVVQIRGTAAEISHI